MKTKEKQGIILIQQCKNAGHWHSFKKSANTTCIFLKKVYYNKC